MDPMETKKPIRDPDFMKRMELAFDLYEAAEQMMRQNLIRRNPGATEEEILEGLRNWLHHRPGAQHGDGEGRLVSRL